MPVRFLFLVLFTLLSFSCLANVQQEADTVYAKNFLYLDKIFNTEQEHAQDSVVFFKKLNKYGTAAQKAGDESLWLHIQLLRNLYYMTGKQKNYRLFESRMHALKDLADKKNIRQLQVLTRQKLGDYYFTVTRNYGLGFDNYLSSYEFLKYSTPEEVTNIQGMLANIGMAYYQFGDNANARKFLNEARQASTASWQGPPRRKSRQLINIINTLGLIYRQEKLHDSAVYYFRQCYRIAEDAQDSTWMGIAAGNIGISLFSLQKYREAIPLLELDVRESKKSGETDNALTSLLVLAQISLHFNDLTKTESQLRQVRKTLPKAKNKNKHLKEFYPLLARLSAIKGDHKRAFLYSDSAHIIKDSLYAQQDGLLALRAERKLEVEKHQADMLQMEAHKKQQTIIRNGLVIVILLLVIISILTIKYLKTLHRQKQLKLESEKNYFASELETATLQLADFTNSIREKNKLLEKYEAEMEQHNLRGSKVTLEASKEAHEKLLQATILTDDQWKNFRQLFDKVHSGYLTRLHAKLPDLSPAETRFFVLSKLNLTPKEMAAMLGIRPDSIRLYRHRLRKKLNIETDSALEELIHGI